MKFVYWFGVKTTLAALFLIFTPCLFGQQETDYTIEELIRKLDQMGKNYEKRFQDLENCESPDCEAHQEHGNGFNPSIGVVVDLLGHLSDDNESRHGEDGFWLRIVELSFYSEIKSFGYGYAVVEGSEGESAELIEGAIVMDSLPYHFSVKGGRMLADVTRFGGRHVHELPFVEKPGVVQQFIGGSLLGTGAQVRQNAPVNSSATLSWSAGVFHELEGHGHAFGIEHDHSHGHESDSKRHLDNFHYTGRLSMLAELNGSSSLEAGSSVWWAPDTLVEDDGDRFHLHRTVGAFDLTYKWADPASQDTFYLGGEALVSNGTFLIEGASGHEIHDEEAFGGYLWCEYSWDPRWSGGLLGDAYALVDNPKVGQRDYSAFLTWRIAHSNRLRLQFRYNDLERGLGSRGRDYSELMVQWTVILGSHRHGPDC